LEGRRAEASGEFQKLVDFYVSMNADHVSKLQEVPSLDQDDQSSIAQYRVAIAAAKGDGSLVERIEFLRTAQGIGFSVFGTASGALLSQPDYTAWRKDSIDSGLAFPTILRYNQAAQSLNDEIAVWPGNMFAWVLGLKPLVLLDVNGTKYQPRPSRI
jgi:hypothetical protein